ncbi:MAG: ATP-binding protein [Pirellulales bacterium]
MQNGSENSDASLAMQVQALRDELRHAQKMTALGELVSTTTHEFNNVLTTILNYAKLGLRHTDQATRTKSLEKILSAAQRAEKITNSVLGLARSRGNDPVPTDLASLVEEALVLLERELMKYRVQVELRLEPAPRAMVVGNQIQQVLLNLVTNARQAMPHGGQVLIRVAEDVESGTVDLVVRDTGGGIPADKLPRIFDRFFTTKSGPDASGKGGTGVGLSMCRDIVEAHGGKIRVESTLGKGTAFTLKLPIAKTPAEASSQPIAKLGLPVGAL